MVLQAEHDTVWNGRHDEVETEYDYGDVVRDLIHRQLCVLQIQDSIFERVHTVQCRWYRRGHCALQASVTVEQLVARIFACRSTLRYEDFLSKLRNRDRFSFQNIS